MAGRVLLLATKDTMAYARRPGHEAVACGADLLRSIAEDLVHADVTVEDVLCEPGWDISPSSMLALACRARSAILDDGFDGVVIAHGADALEETAFLTDLLAGPATRRGGIVLTSAMRHLDDLSADGPRNLASSITAAADPALPGAGVVACLNDELHAARWVTMVDATSVAAFSSAPFAPLGRVVAGRIERLGSPPPRPPEAPGEPESDVALIKTYPGIDPALLSAAVDSGARGVVLEGTGLGNVPVSLFTTINELTEWGIPVVIASRCRTHGVALDGLPRDIGLAGRVGAIRVCGLSAAKARVAVMVALGGGGVAAVREWFRGFQSR